MHHHLTKQRRAAKRLESRNWTFLVHLTHGHHNQTPWALVLGLQPRDLLNSEANTLQTRLQTPLTVQRPLA